MLEVSVNETNYCHHVEKCRINGKSFEELFNLKKVERHYTVFYVLYYFFVKKKVQSPWKFIQKLYEKSMWSPACDSKNVMRYVIYEVQFAVYMHTCWTIYPICSPFTFSFCYYVGPTVPHSETGGF